MQSPHLRSPVAQRPGISRLTMLASGDFACNLYWQSISLFLLFFYTDVLHLSPALGGLLYTIGALWDGLADLSVGIVLQRRTLAYRPVVAWAAFPLGLAFVWVYASGATFMVVLTAQIAFRTLYATVNVPYVAWSARISDDSRDRATLAGLRMVFGTIAAVVVALGTPWIGGRFTGEGDGVDDYIAAAIVFAVLATPVLLIVARSTPEAVPMTQAERSDSAAVCARALLCNKAFVTLNLAAMASTISAALLGQSVLYYFSHVVGDAARGPRTLAEMGIAGAVAVPFWMVIATRSSARSTWLVAVVAGLAITIGFATLGGTAGSAATMFFIAMQWVLSGLNLSFWAMLPDTVDYGARAGGPRVDAMAFGVAALLQKAALAAAAAVLGQVYARSGYSSAAAIDATTVASIRGLVLWTTIGGLGVSGLIMLANPLRPIVHARVAGWVRRRRTITPPSA